MSTATATPRRSRTPPRGKTSPPAAPVARSKSPTRGSTTTRNSTSGKSKSPTRSSSLGTNNSSNNAARGRSPARSNSTGTNNSKSPSRTSATTGTTTVLGSMAAAILEDRMGFGHFDNEAFEDKVRHCIPSSFTLLASQDDVTQAQEDWYAMEHYNLPVNRQAKRINAGSVATSALLQLMYENPRRMVASTADGNPWNCLEVLQQIKRRVKEYSKVEAKPTMSSSRPIGPPRLNAKQYAPFYIVPPGYTGKRHALLIGVRVGEGPDLKGSHNDITCMQSFLRLYCGFKEADTTVLKDDDIHTEPTKRNILAEFTKLCRLSKPKDVIFIQFSGHGGRTGNNLYICPSDYKRGPIMDETILRDLIKALPKDVHTTMLVDCCYSGTVGDLPYVMKSTRDGAKQEIESYFDTDTCAEMKQHEKSGGKQYQDYKKARAEQRCTWRLSPAKLVYDAAATAAGATMAVGTGVVNVGIGTAQVAAGATMAVGTGVVNVGIGTAQVAAGATMAVGTGAYQAGSAVAGAAGTVATGTATGVYQAGATVAGAAGTVAGATASGVYNAGASVAGAAGNVAGATASGVYNAGAATASGVYNAGTATASGVYNVGAAGSDMLRRSGTATASGVYNVGASVVGAAGTVAGAGGDVLRRSATTGGEALRRSGTGVVNVAGAVATAPFRRSATEAMHTKRRSNTESVRSSTSSNGQRRSATSPIRRTKTDSVRSRSSSPKPKPAIKVISVVADSVTSSVTGAANTVTSSMSTAASTAANTAAAPFRRSNTETVRSSTGRSQDEEDFEAAARREAVNRSKREAAEARASAQKGPGLRRSQTDNFDCPVARARPEAVAARIASRSKSPVKRSVTMPKTVGATVEKRTSNGAKKATPAGSATKGRGTSPVRNAKTTGNNSPLRRTKTVDNSRPATRDNGVAQSAFGAFSSMANAMSDAATSAANAAATTATSAANAAATTATSAANAAADVANAAGTATLDMATAAGTAATNTAGGLRRTVTAPVRSASPMRTKSPKRTLSPKRTSSLEEKNAEEKARQEAVERSRREAQQARAAARR